jgi:tRNA(adenine34) deaminase
MNQDEFFLQNAVQCAQKAFDQNEVPVGAIVVDGSGEIIASGWNCIEQDQNQASHAEMLVLQLAAQIKGTWRLDDCTLYISLEPCLMCLGAMYLFRIKRLVYAAKSPLFGAISVYFENDNLFKIYKNFSLEVEYIENEESNRLLKKFFKAKRKQK